MSTIPAGWYPDPADPLQERLWDGSEWTERVRTRLPCTDTPLRQVEVPQLSPPTLPTPSTARSLERDDSKRVKVVQSAMGAYWCAALAACIAGVSMRLFSLRPDIAESLVAASGLVMLVALGTLVVSGARHSREARQTGYFVPSSITSLVVVLGSVALYLATLQALGLLADYTETASSQANVISTLFVSSLLASLMITAPVGAVFVIQLCGLFGKDRASAVVMGLGTLLIADGMYLAAELAVNGAEVPAALVWVAPLLQAGLWKLTPAYRTASRESAADVNARAGSGNLSEAELLEITLTGSVDEAISAVNNLRTVDALRIVVRKTTSQRVQRAARRRLRTLKQKVRKS